VTKEQMLDEMCSLIGGRVAEEIINGQPSTGALNDLERLTKMAYGMVSYYGMSDKVGNLSYYDSTGSRAYDLNRPYSEKTAELIDNEVKELIKMIHDRTESILRENFDGFNQLSAILLEKEVIFADDLENIFGPRAGAKPQDQENTVVEETPAEEVVTEEVTTEE
jgi:cell division protease FtsH